MTDAEDGPGRPVCLTRNFRLALESPSEKQIVMTSSGDRGVGSACPPISVLNIVKVAWSSSRKRSWSSALSFAPDNCSPWKTRALG